MTYEEFRKFAEGDRWTFAKTMPTCPHEYIIKTRTIMDDRTFADMVRFIFQNGFPAYYYSNGRRYLYLDGRYYWTCGQPGNEDYEVTINRCLASDYRVSMRPIKK